MQLEYTSLEELIASNKEAVIFDINKHVIRVLSKLPNYLDALQETPDGIYIGGNIEPIINFDLPYFYKDFSGANEKTRIKDFKENLDEVLTSGKDIVNASGKIVLQANTARIIRKLMLKEKPSTAMLSKMAICMVLSYLNSLSEYTRINYSEYRFENLVKKEYNEVKYEQIFEAAFDDLLLEVRDFVGKDRYNFYFYSVKQSSLIIEKSVDYRIYDWYRIKLEEIENQTEQETNC